MTRKSKKRKSSSTRSARKQAPRRNRYVAALAPAAELEARGDFAGAQRAYKDVLARHPQLIDAHIALAGLLAGHSRFDEARACLLEAIRVRPKALRPRMGLAELYRTVGRPDQGVECLVQCLDLEPDNAEVHFQLGFAYLGAQQVELGVESFRKALLLQPTHVNARLRLGQALHVLRRSEEAEQTFRQLLSSQPKHGYGWLGLGQVLMRKGAVEEARRCFTKALTIDPALPDASTALSRSHRYTEHDNEEVELLSKLALRSDRWPEVRADYQFALGKIMDDLHRYDDAFRYYEQGNRLARARKKHFDMGQLKVVVDRIINTFSADYFEARADFGSSSQVPVFVVGMQRSGTTLVEQILASHPRVYGADELPYIDELSHTLVTKLGADVTYPRCAPQMSRELSIWLGEEYVRRVQLLSCSAQRIVDKMPGNLFHLGFIASVLPGATVIHCARSPMDVALSIFFQQFENGHEWTYSLDEIASYYREYDRAIKHWRSVAPLDIFEVSYENLTGNQESVTRALIAHCQLPWDDACLSYFETSRDVGSASNWQVRQPMYKRSVERWRHYREHLGELEQGLRAQIAEYAQR